MSALHAGRIVTERDAVLEQKFVRGRLVVGERPLHTAIVVAGIRHAVGLDDRPVGQILEQDVWRIDDAVLFWALKSPPSGTSPLMMPCPPMS